MTRKHNQHHCPIGGKKKKKSPQKKKKMRLCVPVLVSLQRPDLQLNVCARARAHAKGALLVGLEFLSAGTASNFSHASAVIRIVPLSKQIWLHISFDGYSNGPSAKLPSNTGPLCPPALDTPPINWPLLLVSRCLAEGRSQLLLPSPDPNLSLITASHELRFASFG